MSEQMSSAVHCAIRRVKMPDGTLSALIGWMHRKITQHQLNNRRWVEAHPTERALSDAYRYHGRRPKVTLTPAEKQARKAAYMRTYRAKVKADKEAMLRKVKKQDWDFWRAKDEAKKQARRNRWAKRFGWKTKRT